MNDYSYFNPPDDGADKEMEAQEQMSIEKAQSRKEDSFYCYSEETIGAKKCGSQCEKCLDIETHLQK